MSDAGRPPLRTQFHEAMDEANDALVEAALLTAEAMPGLLDRFFAGDRDSIAEARALHDRVQAGLQEVEDKGFLIIAKESPVGSDLRQVVAMLRVVFNIDRATALLRHVNESLEQFDPRELPEESRQRLRDLATRSHDVFRAGVEAWRRRDSEAGRHIDELDDAVDHLRDQVLEGIQDGDRLAGAGWALGLLTRYLERIADHGVSLARDIAFVVTGDRAPIDRR